MQLEAKQAKNFEQVNQHNHNSTQPVNQMVEQINAETMLDLVLGPKYSQSQSTCPHCQHRFNKRSHLYRHLRQKHEQVRQFICEFEACGKQFKRGSHLKRHMISHTHEKKFKCLKCIMEFGYKHHLDRHIKLIHDKELFKCTQCDRQFNKKKGLAKHKKEHQMINLKKNKKIKKMKKQKKEEQDQIFNESDCEEKLVKQDSVKEVLFQSSLQQSQSSKIDIQKDEMFITKKNNQQLIQIREQDLVKIMHQDRQQQNSQKKEKQNTTLNWPQIGDLISVQSKTKNRKARSIKQQNKQIILFRCDQANCLHVYKSKYSLKNHYKISHPQTVLQFPNNQ